MMMKEDVWDEEGCSRGEWKNLGEMKHITYAPRRDPYVRPLNLRVGLDLSKVAINEGRCY